MKMDVHVNWDEYKKLFVEDDQHVYVPTWNLRVRLIGMPCIRDSYDADQNRGSMSFICSNLRECFVVKQCRYQDVHGS
jgi:hypothetical protein